MTAKKAAVCLLLWGAVAQVLQAQTLSGVVRDTTGALLEQVSVVVSEPLGRVLAYTYTDQQGAFRLSFQTQVDTLVLNARLIGYQSRTLRLARLEVPMQVNVTLGGTAVLQLVEVHGKMNPVAVRGDTTVFQARRYSDSTEFSVEELLKKLPGVRVGDNGQITYNGKQVERVMIEGDDLFGEQFTLGTRNIRATSIAEVQVIDHYQDNPLLRGVRSSEKMVMNLTLQSDKKRRLSGSTELDAGWGGRGAVGRTHLNLFSISRKEKIYAIANANNIGQQALPPEELSVDKILASRRKQQDLQTEFPMQTALPLPLLENAGLPALYTQPNRTGLLFAGAVLPEWRGWHTKSSAWLSSVAQAQETQSDTRFFLPGNELTIAEDKSTTLRRQTAHWQLESQWSPAHGRYGLRCYVQLTGKPADYTLDIRRSPAQNGAEDIRGDGWKQGKGAHVAVEYTRKMRKNAAFQWIGKVGWHGDDSRLEAGYGYYSAYFQTSDRVDRLLQTARQRQVAAYTAAMWTGRSHGWEWHLEQGLDYTRRHLRSEVRLRTPEGRLVETGSPFHNDYRFSTPLLFAGGYLQRKTASQTVQFRLKTGYLPMQLWEMGTDNRSKTAFWALPRVQWRRDVGGYGAFSAHYEYEQAPPGALELMPRFLFSDYQTLAKGLPDLSPTAGHRAGARYTYNRVTRHFMWYIGGNAQHSTRQFGSRFSIQPYLSERTLFRPVARSGWRGSAGMERYVGRIRSLFVVDADLSRSTELLQFEVGQATRFEQTSHYLHLQYGTAFNTWVNVTLEARRMQQAGKNLATGGTTTATSWLSSVQLRIKPAPAFDAGLSLYRVANRAAGRAFQISHAAQAQAFWRIPRYRSVFSATAVNLLGVDAYQLVFSDAFSQNTTHVAAVPAFFTIGWEWQF